MLQMGFSQEEIQDSLVNQKYNDVMATYLLLDYRNSEVTVFRAYQNELARKTTETIFFRLIKVQILPVDCQSHTKINYSSEVPGNTTNEQLDFCVF